MTKYVQCTCVYDSSIVDISGKAVRQGIQYKVAGFVSWWQAQAIKWLQTNWSYFVYLYLVWTHVSWHQWYEHIYHGSIWMTCWHVTSTYVSAVHRRLQMQQKSCRIQICLEFCQSGQITSCLVEEKLKCNCWQTNNCQTLSPKSDETLVESQKRFFCNYVLSLNW